MTRPACTTSSTAALNFSWKWASSTCSVQKYASAGAEIAVEAYRMESAAAALGIYLLKCSRETPLAGDRRAASGDRFQIRPAAQ